VTRKRFVFGKGATRVAIELPQGYSLQNCYRGCTLRLAERKAIADTQRIRDKSWALWQLAAGCSKDRGCKLENLGFPVSRDP
jgi:hypothetical protein